MTTESHQAEPIGTATYSPEDNKLRLYPFARLPRELYDRVKAAGFSWAPRQELFVAPMWTPDREDLLIELCGEVGDEDKSLVERAEERADRFEGYKESRQEDAEQARKAVSAIADNIPFGQPILVGHHSERHARKDAERIENGMRKAVKMWETAKYWTDRAAGALAHAKYKELPDVRARRIKGIEADKRKRERQSAEAIQAQMNWEKIAQMPEEKQMAAAIYLSGHTTQGGDFTMPKKAGDREDWNQRPCPYSALSGHYPTLYAPRTVAEVVERARQVFPARVHYLSRWIAHFENRLAYEKAMLAEQGASELLAKKPRPKQLPLCNYRAPFIEYPNMYNRGEMMRLSQVEMTAAEYAAIHNDYKGTRIVERSHRIRTAVVKHALVAVFLTDSKVHEKPAPGAPPEPKEPRVPPRVAYNPPARTAFDDMRDSLRSGVKVVTAPQLFPTPVPLANRVAELADVREGHRVLEPSAGTGNLISALLCRADWKPDLWAVEHSVSLCEQLRRRFPGLPVKEADFLECNGDIGTFDRILMNPPFENGADIKHIKHAITKLNPGGKLVAICAAGPRQERELQPLATSWEPLPEDTFKDQGTSVRTVLLTIDAP